MLTLVTYVSVVAMSRSDEGDIEGARSLAKASMWVSIAGTIIGIIAIIVILVLYFTMLQENNNY